MTTPTNETLDAVAKKITALLNDGGQQFTVEDLCKLAEAASRIAEADKMASMRNLS